MNLVEISLYNRVGENNIGAPKMQNYFCCAIYFLFIFNIAILQYWTFSLLCFFYSYCFSNFAVAKVVLLSFCFILLYRFGKRLLFGIDLSIVIALEQEIKEAKNWYQKKQKWLKAIILHGVKFQNNIDKLNNLIVSKNYFGS